jgi:predicted nicotinamide N-methyase
MTTHPINMQTRTDTITIGAHNLTLETANNFDDILNYYAEHHPNAVELIPYYAHLWDSAHALCFYLQEHASAIYGTHVLELGCGLALPSLLCAALGATHVTATDFHPDVAEFVARNIAHNNLQKTITYTPFNWQDPTAKLPLHTTVPDIILASDVLYEAAAVEPFARCVASLCPQHGKILLADPGRSRLEEAIDHLTRHGFRHDLYIQDNTFILNLQSNTEKEQATI